MKHYNDHELSLRINTDQADDVFPVIDGKGDNDVLNELLRQAGQRGIHIIAVTESRIQLFHHHSTAIFSCT